MSLSTMTNDLPRPGDQPSPGQPEGIGAGGAGGQGEKSGSQRAYDALAKFIPTEILAPFIMVMQLIKEEEGSWSEKAVIWTFVFLTPVFLVLFEYAKTAQAGTQWPNKGQVAWRAVAAMIAFWVWSLSVPGNVYQEVVGGVAIAGLMAVLISPVLTAVDAIVLRLISGARG